ncbi:DUF485 domain-containing protein [Nocardiopsis sp. ATB16-24]|uniref:DUF485 domain-containing protein n=1 Tax=Nocardiopsis sp. ATB16-24 TaxID=3019555 RepID=UPI0025569652|nr:DUF485 domain-containing protein [Nocardiopsis sp. ATB16-24]
MVDRRRDARRARAYERMSVDPSFVALRKRFALLAGALVSVFLSGYLSHLLLAAYARDLMSVRIADSVNVALVMGVGQFALTFVLAWGFVRLSERALDPLARELVEKGREEEGAEGTEARTW